MSGELNEFESVLRRALAPVEPPADLYERLEMTLSDLTEMAADELEAWELRSMRDPRNWARPAAAAVVGTTAGAALIVVRARRRSRGNRRARTGQLVERAVRDVAAGARRVWPPA